MFPSYTTNTEDIVYDWTARQDDNLVYQESERSITFSEKSYLPLFTSEEILGRVADLNYSLTWHFYALLATNIMYFMISYEVFFDTKIDDITLVTLLKLLCNALLLVDSGITLYHYFNKNLKYKMAYGNIDVVLVITQSISLLIFPLQMVKFLIRDSVIVSSILIAVYILRYYKLLIYMFLMHRIPGEMTLTNLSRKNFILVGVLVHSFACMWMSVGCFEKRVICEKKFSGPNSYWNVGEHFRLYLLTRKDAIKELNLTAFENYVVCLYYITGGLTHVGFGGSSLRNYTEDLICIAAMFVYIFMIYGLQCSEFSSYVIHLELVEFDMYTRRQAITRDLYSTKFIRRSQRRKMLTYYEDFWEKDRAIKTSSMLNVIPRSLLVDTQHEIFWVFLNKCYLLRYTSASFRRAIAATIKIEVLNKGDVLYQFNGVSENVYYIARGNIEILSSEDGNSTLLALGKGTCLGQMHLLGRTVTRFKVLIASYCVVYIINKKDFWIEVRRFRKLHVSSEIHQNYRIKIQRAQRAKAGRKSAYVDNLFRKWKCVVSKKILTSFKDKIKGSEQEWVKLGSLEHEDPHILYTYGQVHSQKTYDEIFLNSSFPWILQQNSQFLNLWNLITIGVVVCVSIFYPYKVAFTTEFDTMTVHVVSAVYVMDVIIQLFTAIDTRQEVIANVEDITLARLESIKFCLDIIAAFPVYLISLLSQLNSFKKRVVFIANLNKLLKLHKVDVIFKKLENNTHMNTTFVRALKLILYLLYAGYISGCIFFIIDCFEAVTCAHSSWISVVTETNRKFISANESRFIDLINIRGIFVTRSMLYVVSGTTADVTVNLTEIAITLIVAALGVLIMVYFFAKYIASVTLTKSAAVEYMEFMNTVKDYMSYTGMNDELKVRIVVYLENIWVVNKGRVIKDLYYDCPEQIYNQNQILRYGGYLLQTDLFKYTSSDLQNVVASRCTELYLPPHEYLLYSGQTCLNFYIIISGYCAVIEGLPVQKTLPPGTTINAIEIFAGLPSLLTVRTETHCKFLKCALEDIQFMVKTYPTFMNEMLGGIDQTAVDRIFSRIGEVRSKLSVKVVEDEIKSFFLFPTSRRDPLNLDYRRGFHSGKWKLFKYFMMRRTILPTGPFYKYWEFYRALSAPVVSLLAPCSLIHAFYFPYLQYLLYVLYCFSLIDIYLKMHLCYYNKQGILVTHPRFTAIHYVSHSFLLDAISAFPLSWIVRFLANTRNCKVETILHFNVAIQMYRYPNAFALRKPVIYDRDSVIMAMLKTIPFTLVIINILSCTLLCISSEEVTRNDAMSLRRVEYCWIEAIRIIRHLRLYEPWVFYLVACYCTAMTITGIGFRLLRPVNIAENIYTISCVLIGYLMKIYIVGRVAHNQFNVAQKLTQHRNYMVQLSKYMKEEKLPKDLQHRIIEHYDHLWQITHAVKPSHIFSMLHIPLKMDVVVFLYKNTLKKVPVFQYANESFYRHFGLGLNELYVMKDTSVIKLNDIVTKVYIIHKGEALVLGPDGAILANLQEGSMFGNLDNVEAVRNMVTIRTVSMVDLLVIDTKEMYQIFENFGYISSKLQHYLLLENFSYVVGKSADEEHTQEASFTKLEQRGRVQQNLPKFKIFLMKLHVSLPMIVFDVLASLLCCWLASYQVAFVTSFDVFYSLYLLDLFHLANLVCLMMTPYRTKRGDLIDNTRDIFKHYLKSWRFYIDVITVPPYDLIGFLFPNSTEIRRLIALYRLIRIINVYHGFDRATNAFGIKIVLFRLMKMSIYIIFVTHLCACFWYYRACPQRKCNKNSWVYSWEKINCEATYICSIYLGVSIISTTGFPNRIPTDGFVDMLLCTMLAILGQYLMGSIVGDTIALVRNSTMHLAEYNFEWAIFKTYMKNSSISIPFLDSMRKYCISLWTVGSGSQIPTYLKSMPSYLLEDLKLFAYGEHIYKNIFFENCHKDFLRQVITKLRAEYYFVDDVICHQEDVNDTMYFIHKGTVNVYSVTAREEFHIDQLTEMDSFGIIQGLFSSTPHTHTFKASTVCIIVYLRYKDIAPLLTFYPASKFEIYSSLMLLFPDKPATQKFRKGVVYQRDELIEVADFVDEIDDENLYDREDTFSIHYAT